MHVRHAEQLAGKDETGRLRTRNTQAYPPEMNKALAQTHFDYIMKRRSGTRTRLSDEVLRDSIDQWASLRGAQAAGGELPKTFAEALG